MRNSRQNRFPVRKPCSVIIILQGWLYVLSANLDDFQTRRRNRHSEQFFPLVRDCRALLVSEMVAKNTITTFSLKTYWSNKINQTKSNLLSRVPLMIGSDSFDVCAQN